MIESQKIVSKAAHIRGSFITDIIFLERIMDEFICRHFCSDNDKKVELLESLIATKRVTFDSKLEVAKFIITNHHPTFINNYPNWVADIRGIIEHRNIFAHYLLDTSDEGFASMKTGVIQFLKFEKKTIPITYTQDKIKEIDNKLRLYIKAFGDMQ